MNVSKTSVYNSIKNINCLGINLTKDAEDLYPNIERNVNVIMLHCGKDVSSLYRFRLLLKEILANISVEIEKVDF